MCDANETSDIKCFNCEQPMPADSKRHPGLDEYLCAACTVPAPEPAKHCEVCGRTLNLALYPRAGTQDPEYLCPKHSQERALNKAAHDHLTDLVNHVLREWVLHWGQTATSVEDIAYAIEWCFADQGNMPYQERQEYVRSILTATSES